MTTPTDKRARFRMKRASKLALAVAIATGSVVGATGFAEPAFAAKKDKKDDREYSKEFVAAFNAVNELVNAETADTAAIKAATPALEAAIKSADEQYTGGGVLYNAGGKVSDDAMRLRGMSMMLDSGKVPAENVAKYNYIGYELARGANDWAKARTYLKAAIDNGFTHPQITMADMQRAYADTYVQAGDNAGAVDYLLTTLSPADGSKPDPTAYATAVGVAYKAEAVPQIYEITSKWVTDYPTVGNWRDAINIARNLNDYEGGAILDLLRLGNRLGALNSQEDYLIYIEAADPRRLPQEVASLIEGGYSSGKLQKSDTYVAEMLGQAKGRIASDKADLPALERDANKAGAALKTVTAAADAFLSYGEAAKAAALYQKALGMPGVDTATVTTRLGIAQVTEGKYNEAQATFAKVQGPRQPIAKLWATYAAQNGAAPTS